MPNAECTDAVTGTTICLTPELGAVGVRVDRAGAAEGVRARSRAGRSPCSIVACADQVGHPRVDDRA